MVVAFELRFNGSTFPLSIVENMAFGGTQSVIIYESPGTNGGTVITTGRTNNVITLSGKLLRVEGTTLEDIKNEIEDIRDVGQPVVLVAPLNSNDTGQYIIERFEGNVLPGIESYVPFTLTLQEYRQANIRNNNLNLVSFEPAEQARETTIAKNIASESQ